MDAVYVLSITTSLPEVCFDRAEMKTSAGIYTTFEEARAAARKALREYAFSENAMFDGNGYMRNFNAYIDNMRKIEESGLKCEPEQLMRTLEYLISKITKNEANTPEEDAQWATADFFASFHEKLRSIFLGEDMPMPLNKGCYEEGFVEMHVGETSVTLKGCDEGEVNDVRPFIRTNMFDMREEDDYFLYLDDFFGGLWDQEASAELYLELKRVPDRQPEKKCWELARVL